MPSLESARMSSLRDKQLAQDTSVKKITSEVPSKETPKVEKKIKKQK